MNNPMQNMIGISGLFFIQGNQVAGMQQMPLAPSNLAFLQQMPMNPSNNLFSHQQMPQQEFFFSQPGESINEIPVAMDLEDKSDDDEDDEGIVRNTK